MGTLLGGSRWDDELTPLDDDWYAYKTEQELKDDPIHNWDRDKTLDFQFEIPEERYKDIDTIIVNGHKFVRENNETNNS